jgi:ABC-type polar amino acid transport system ATPase subunit
MIDIEFKGVRKSFGTNEVLRGIDLHVPAGRTFAVIGESGSGKSTLVRCINTLERINAGSIRVGRTVIKSGTVEEDGAVLSSSQIAAFRTRVGMVFQNFNLFPHLTVLGNIIEAPIHVLRWEKERAIMRGTQLLRRVGLEDKASAHPATLSGGQQQRVAIVRSLIMDPAIMLFDEPTSALDPKLTDEVLSVIRDLAISDRTSIIVTHEMAFANNVATDVIVMSEGEIAEMGPPAQIFGAPESDAAKRLLQYTHYKQ